MPADASSRQGGIEEVEADPLWFPVAVSADLRALQFQRVTADELGASPFLDARHLGGPRDSLVVDLEECDLAGAVERLRKANPPPAFIFHTAFCRSTLLAAALNQTDACLALKEPDILRQAGDPLRSAPPARARLIAQLIMGLLQRPVRRGQAVVIKPSNLANPWLRFAAQEECPALLLYGPLRDFLVSILLREEPGRVFARQVFAMLAEDGGALAQVPADRAFLLTDLQVAALAWRQQMEIFAAAASGAPAQVRTLCSLDLGASPDATMTAACRFLGVPATPATLARVVEGPLFRRDAKHPDRAFDGAQHGATRDRIASMHGDSLEEVGRWAATLRLACDFNLPLPGDLLST